MTLKSGVMTWILVLGLGAAGASQSVWTTVKEWDSGPSNRRTDIVILGDGYTAAEMPLFRTHVTNFINYWFGTDPIGRYRHLVNIWRVEVVSAQSGADHPGPCFSPPVFVNTALNATYCTGGVQRCVTADAGLTLATAVINVPEYDEIVVLVNDAEYGGCASTFSTSTGVHPAASDVVAHELGHSMIGLADEYWNAGTTYTGGEFGQANATVQNAAQIAATQTKWSHWLNVEGVTAHEGCRYFEFGVFRPKSNCKMRSLFVDFCPVCREETLEECWLRVTGPDSVTPATTGFHPYATTFSADIPTVLGLPLVSEWHVDGILVNAGMQAPTGAVTTLSFNPGSVLVPNSGSHTVTLKVVDPTTWYRKSTRYEVMPPINWLVSDTASNLTPTAFSLLTTPLRAGGLFAVSDSVTNTGITASPAVTVGYYVSTDALLTVADFLVGTRNLSGLAVGAVSTTTTMLRLPHLMPSGALRFGIIVDPGAVAAETVETDNSILLGAVPINGSPALQASTFALLWIVDSTATVSVDFGVGQAGRNFAILPSLALQSPAGTNMGPFIGTAPFIADDLSLAVANGSLAAPYFLGFVGTLDSLGRATASFHKPAIVPALGGVTLSFFAFATGLDPLSMAPVVSIISNRAGLLIF